ncbi:MAG: LPS export ABC transporter periplasmic protein LptC [Bacteroidetes bacterium]|nr:LPS export ABC transporter periplasmic protein LptC [Bacteroidota bacterium]MBU1680509.1 LPS export ABC transporter periplasmic protein LptC [Bacteroidota bacterium]MBU2507557.1 LPS export ABC transporter periplasmic protein LptC [Bacteroidota bacterium]
MKIFIAALIVIVFAQCADHKVKPKIDLNLEDKNLPSQESWNSKILFTESGKLKAVLFSYHIEAFENPKEKKLTGVLIDFYNQEGVKASVLTSKRGRVDDITQNMFAIDSVVAVNDSAGTKLETSELMWRNTDRKITTEKFVTITTNDEIIEGYGFESDQTLQNYVIHNVTYQTTKPNGN